MKRLSIYLSVAAIALMFAWPAGATWYTFQFSEEDLWNHTPSSDTRLYNQDAPRRHHTFWKADVQTTDSTQPNQTVYQTQPGTNGWYQTNTYDTWLLAGPKDNLGNNFGICDVQLWGAGYPNARLAWNERYRVNAGAGAWQILSTPAGWTGAIVENPWPDNGNPTPLDQYYIDWTANSYGNRILYSSFGNSVADYLFTFKVDIIGEYPTAREQVPNGNPFETDGSLRLWFGGYVLNTSGEWTDEGFDGVIQASPVPLPGTLLLLGTGLLGLAILGRRRYAKK